MQISVGALPTYHARNDPNRALLIHNDGICRRAEFDARANKRARALQQKGVGQGDFVTMALPNGLEFYETIFAIWKLGAVPCPVSAALPRAELEAIIGLVQPRLVIAPPDLVPSGHPSMLAGAPVDETLSSAPLPDVVSPHLRALTSGGSTGRPKVIVDHLPGIWDTEAELLRQRADDVLLNPGPLYHNSPLSMTCCALFIGAVVVEMGKFDALRALELIERHRVSFVTFVPTMMHRIWRLPERERFDVSSLRTVYHMASVCPTWLKEAWIDWLGADRIWEMYGGSERQGGTEISGHEWLLHKGSVGRPLANCKLRVLDEDGEICQPGVVGEIYFLNEGGRGATYHYIGAEAKAHGEWETLGDMGHLDEEGYLYIADRRTDMIVSGGANVYPAEVEAALDMSPHVASSIVIGLPDEDLGHRVHALIELSAEARGVVAAEDLRDHLAAHLTRYKIPRSFEFVDHALRDDAGKARRSALREARVEAS